jgi:serine protease Do
MSIFNLNSRNPCRNRMLASAAVAAMITSGGIVISAPAPASAAAIDTADLQSQTLPSFAKVVGRVRPAVVSVKVKIEDASARSDNLSGEMDNLPPQVGEFFKRFGDPKGSFRNRQGSQPVTGQGSGFFISADGYVVTSSHVVENAKTVTVTTDDGKTLDAKVIGAEPKTDLALLKVIEKGDYPFVSFVKEAPRVGDWVLGIGNPIGLGDTVTAGIIAADGRYTGNEPYDQFLQIEAPIMGNAGGPTFNLKGEVVGVNTAISSPSGGSVGLGFAIPASIVESVINSLEHAGVVSRGYLGVMIQPVNQDIADGLGLEAAAGALIDNVEPGTPAAEAGLKSGDVITKLNAQAVKDASDLTRQVGSVKPGEKVEISFLRDGAKKTVSIALAAQKNEQAAIGGGTENEGALILGVQLAPANQIVGAGDQGVAIVNVDPNGMAASKGLSDGDIILDVSGKAVSQPSEVKADIAAAKLDGKKAVVMKIKTAQGDRFVAFEFPKA